MDALNKIYVEPTNRCNLQCVTCIRHVWDEPFGDMDWSVYRMLIDGLADFPEAKTVAFAGLGEPLLHARFPEMVRLAHERGLRTEMTSNARLLTPEMARRLLDAGLDQFTVSIDGATSEAYETIRPGASLEQLIANVAMLYRMSAVDKMAPIRIGIEFVAMKRNIRELPEMGYIARRIGASFILVTNVLPYTADLQDEILYNVKPSLYENPGSPRMPLWILPNMDFNRETQEPLSQIFRGYSNFSFLDISLGQRSNYCPFVGDGSVAIGWHGGVSPCPPLMHTYSCFIRKRPKTFLRCEFGRLANRSLRTIWTDPAFSSFRERVQMFDFPPCTDCGGCQLAETNESDCINNPFPVCGDCLWARGILRCA